MGAGKSLNRREKNSGKEKSGTRIRAPGDKVLTDQFQTVGVILASDWCQKIFVFFCPITEQQDYESFRVFLHKGNIQACCSPYLSGSLAEGLLEEESFNHSRKCKGDHSAYLQKSRRRYAGPFAGTVTLAYLKYREFLNTH